MTRKIYHKELEMWMHDLPDGQDKQPLSYERWGTGGMADRNIDIWEHASRHPDYNLFTSTARSTLYLRLV